MTEMSLKNVLGAACPYAYVRYGVHYPADGCKPVFFYMKKIILPEQTYFVTTNTVHRQWVFARNSAVCTHPHLRRGWSPRSGIPPSADEKMVAGESPPSRWAAPQTRTRGSLSAEGANHVLPSRSVVPDRRSCMIAVDNITFYRKKFGYCLHGFVFMPDHVHPLLTVGKKGTISEVMRDWKSRVAFEI